MPKVILKHNSFKAGELSPRLFGRSDVAYYDEGCKRAENIFIKKHGAVIKRAGTEYIYSVGTAPPPADPISYTDCGRIGSLVDVWEFDTDFAYQKDTLHVEDDTYIIAYSGKFKTFTVDIDGNFGPAALDDQSLPNPGETDINIVKLSSTGVTNYFAAINVHGWGGMPQVQTFYSDVDGIINWIDYRDFTSTTIGTPNTRAVVRMTGTFYAVAGSRYLAVIDISDTGIVGDVKDTRPFYSIGVSESSQCGVIRLGTTEYIIASRSYPTWQESIGCYRIQSGTGEITEEDTFDIPASTYAAVFGFIDGYSTCGFSGFLMASRDAVETKGIQVQSISMTGSNFGSVVDTIKIGADYAASECRLAHIGGAGFIMNFSATINTYSRDCVATFICREDGTLEIQDDITVVYTDMWSQLYAPIPIQLHNNPNIWLLGTTHIGDQDGYLFTTNIYGSEYCMGPISCDKYG